MVEVYGTTGALATAGKECKTGATDNLPVYLQVKNTLNHVSQLFYSYISPQEK